jgi:hypothetical protein
MMKVQRYLGVGRAKIGCRLFTSDESDVVKVLGAMPEIPIVA